MARIAIIGDGPLVPNLFKAGGRGNKFILRALASLGHDVTFLALWDPKFSEQEIQQAHPEATLCRIRPTANEIKNNQDRPILFPPQCPEGVRQSLGDAEYDAIILIGIDAMMAARGATGHPSIGCLSIPEDLQIPWRLRCALAVPGLTFKQKKDLTISFARSYLNARSAYRELRNAVDLIVSADPSLEGRCGRFGRLGFRHYPAPVEGPEEPAGSGLEREPVIAMVNAHGTHSDASYLYFAKHLMPLLETTGKPDFRLKFIGRDRLPPFVRLPSSVAERATVQPFTDDIVRELSRCMGLLMCSPIPAGAANRVKTAMMCGTVPIVHEAVTAGLPELNHGVNCLVASNGRDFLRHLEAVVQDDVLRSRLSQDARRTFEQNFSPAMGADFWNRALEDIGISSRQHGE